MSYKHFKCGKNEIVCMETLIFSLFAFSVMFVFNRAISGESCYLINTHDVQNLFFCCKVIYERLVA